MSQLRKIAYGRVINVEADALTMFILSRLNRSTMTWEPIPLVELQAIIGRDLAECSEEQQSFFAHVAIPPEKWRQSPYGDEGGGFWVVAVYQDRVLWFNDIEEGFNVSTFRTHGEIPQDEYWCNDDPLQWALPNLVGEPRSKLGAPKPFSDNS